MGSVSDKLVYLSKTKTKLYKALQGLGYDVDDETTLREAVNALWDASIEKRVDDFDVTTLPEYWRQEIKDAFAHTLRLGDDYVHHIVLADQHYNKNNKRSAAIVKLLQGTNLFSRVIFLGDNADTNTEEEYSEFVDDFESFAGDSLIVNGNHDMQAAPLAAYYNGFLANDPEIVWGSTSYLYYYWDDADYQIRYICLAHIGGDTAGDAERPKQYNFFVSSLGVPNGWTTVVLTHYTLYPPRDKDGNQRTASGGTLINNSASYDSKLKSIRCFSKHPDRFAAWLHGHYHADSLTMDWNVPQFTFNTDSNKPGNRTAGTTAEQAITIFSINPTTGDMQTYRIGYAYNQYYRQMSANYRSQMMPEGWVYGYYPAVGGGFTASDYWATKLPAYDYKYGTKRLAVYRKDFSGYNGCIADFYDDNGNCIGRATSSNAASLININTHFRYVTLVDLKSNNAATQCNLGICHSGITAENYETEIQNFVFCYEDELPLFPEWTLANAGWVEDQYYTSGTNFTELANAGATNKLVYCEPGQKLTFSVDDAEWSTPWAYFFFFKNPFPEGYTKRIGSSSTVTTITATVPSGCHYYLLSAQNLKGYTDKVTITVE